jgi:hypothetical protein
LAVGVCLVCVCGGGCGVRIRAGLSLDVASPATRARTHHRRCRRCHRRRRHRRRCRRCHRRRCRRCHHRRCRRCHRRRCLSPAPSLVCVQLCKVLGGKLGNEFFQLTQSFHHVIWLGDLNYRCTDVTAAEALALIRSGREGLQTLLQNHDELTLQRRAANVFFEFVEPSMGATFYPTYKKNEGHGVPDRSSPDWVTSVYHTQFKEPLYKGGRTKQRIPGWCDRVLFHSMRDVAGLLEPQAAGAWCAAAGAWRGVASPPPHPPPTPSLLPPPRRPPTHARLRTLNRSLALVRSLPRPRPRPRALALASLWLAGALVLPHIHRGWCHRRERVRAAHAPAPWHGTGRSAVVRARVMRARACLRL